MFLSKATKTEIGRIYLKNIFSVVYVYKFSSIILTYPLYNYNKISHNKRLSEICEKKKHV